MSKEKIYHHLHAPVHEKITVLSLALLAALSLNLVTRESFALAQEQAVPKSSNITAPAVQPDTSQPQPVPQKAPPNSGTQNAEPAPGCPPGEEPKINDQGQQSCLRKGEGKDEEGPQDFVDPREIKNTLQQIKQLRLEIRSLLRQLTQLKDIPSKEEDLAKLKELDARVLAMGRNISSPPADTSQKEALQEFYDARVWDDLQLIRAKIELPRQLKDIGKALIKVEKMLKLKSWQKLGLDMGILQAKLEEIKGTYNQMLTAYQAGNLEEAQELLQEFQQSGSHPGGLEGALYRIKGIKDMLRQIRDKEVNAAIEEMLAPVYESLYEGDFQEVHNVLNEYEDDLRRLVNLIVRSKLRFNKVESKISDLENLIRQKFDNSSGGKGTQPGESSPSSAPLPEPKG